MCLCASINLNYSVLATPSNLPGFWIFMYRVSPFTYLIGAMLSVAVANTDVTCEPVELVYFEPTNGTTCGAYMADYIKLAGGYLTNPEATTSCGFCSVSDTNTFLAGVVSFYSERWRNFGIMWAYVIFNICCAVFIYWLVRVPKNPGRMATKEKES
jgi:ATP-binding cassette, subfamily G (WHITE), member 2, PDR